jgi:hypothetical protein
MNKDKNVSSNLCENKLTEENYKAVESDFLKHANEENFDDSDFDIEDGLRLEWGKYDYNVELEEQEIDFAMLHKAVKQFNMQHQGLYVAFPEQDDKFNSVYIMDLKQISTNESYLAIIQYSALPEHKLAYALIQKTCIEADSTEK